MLRLITNFAVVGSVVGPVVNAIGVAPGSPCSSGCGNVLTSTSDADLVCSQSSYTTNPTGQLFQSCVQCEQGSGYAATTNITDTQWMLYNLRYALNYCLWDVIGGPCVTSKACGKFLPGVEYMNMSTSSVQNYDYCNAWLTTDTVDLTGCTECLQAANQQYLANFVTALEAGCQQKPVKGENIGISGNIFSTTSITITTPSPIATVNPEWFNQGPLGLGGKVGIAVGGLVLILIVLGCGIVWRGKRKRRAFLRKLETNQDRKGWPSPHHQQGNMFESPMSQRPLRGWDDSPQSAFTENGFPRYFSPYSSQYTSPVSAVDNKTMQWPQMDAARSQNIGLAFGGDSPHDDGAAPGGYFDVYSPVEKGKGASQEAYEMHEVDSSKFGSQDSRMENEAQPQHPQMYAQPGYGEYHDGLTEADAKGGYAI